MAFEIQYFHERVYAEVQSWPVDVLADYARLVELLAEHGPSLRLPYSRIATQATFTPSLRQHKDRTSRMAEYKPLRSHAHRIVQPLTRGLPQAATDARHR